MKSLLLLFFILISWVDNVNSQVERYDKIYFSYEIETGVANEELGSTRAGSLYSLLGDYLNSIFYSEIEVSWGIDSVDLSSYTMDSAYRKIMKAARDYQLVVISEAHLKPQHRIFAKKLLVGLKDLGFEYLGMEAWASKNNSNELLDEDLHERGYPLNNQINGIYTIEPRMGDLVRQALKNGYTLFAYEKSENIEGMDRDQIQAENVIRFLDSVGNKKTVLLCGFHHVIEGGTKKYGRLKWMTNIIKDSLGIDPLTIYQDNFTEKYVEAEHNFLTERPIREVSVLVDSTGNIAKLSEEVDVEVIHPKTTFIKGRPDWLIENDLYQEVEIPFDSLTLDFPVLVSGYLESEYDDGVPLDRVEYKHRYNRKPLILKPGKYIIELNNGKEKKTFAVEIKP